MMMIFKNSLPGSIDITNGVEAVVVLDGGRRCYDSHQMLVEVSNEIVRSSSYLRFA
jgi:hypothetical protein